MQSIKEISNKIKTIIDTPLKNNALFTIFIILIVSICSFGLGRLSKSNQTDTPISIQNNNLAIISKSVEAQPPQILPIGGKYVASKNSNKYHAPWCSGAQRIKEENKIWFNSKEEAEASGYTPASNCKGI